MTGRAPAGRHAADIPGAVGLLEAIVELPASESPAAMAVVCHPHPLHRGTMHNKVVHTLARSFLALDAIAVRFNFRGVGSSRGSYDGGEGEQDDALAVVKWMRGKWPALPLYLGGFSFGSMVALRVASRVAPTALITVALPVSSVSSRTEQPQCPWLIVQGDQDEIVDPAAVIQWVNELDAGPQITVVADAGHFFHGRLMGLGETVIDFVRATVSGYPGEDSRAADA